MLTLFLWFFTDVCLLASLKSGFSFYLEIPNFSYQIEMTGKFKTIVTFRKGLYVATDNEKGDIFEEEPWHLFLKSSLSPKTSIYLTGLLERESASTLRCGLWGQSSHGSNSGSTPRQLWYSEIPPPPPWPLPGASFLPFSCLLFALRHQGLSWNSQV